MPAGCGADDGQTPSRICRLGDAAATKTVVVFGNSHIEMWMPPLLRLARPDHFALVPLIKQGLHATALGRRVGQGRVQPVAPVGAHGAADAEAEGDIGGAFDAGIGKPYADTLAALGRTTAAARRVSKAIVIDDPPSLGQQPLDCILGRGADMRRCSSTPSAGQLDLRSELAGVVTTAGGRFLDNRLVLLPKPLPDGDRAADRLPGPQPHHADVRNRPGT